MQIDILDGNQCRFRSVVFCRSQLIWIYTVCKDREYPGSAGLGLIRNHILFTVRKNNCIIPAVKQSVYLSVVIGNQGLKRDLHFFRMQNFPVYFSAH